MSFSQEQLIDVFRQWPWIYPRGLKRSAAAWVSEAQRDAGWYDGLRRHWRELIYPGGVVVNPPPAGLPSAARVAFRQVASRRYPEAATFHFSGASIIGDAGMVVTPNNRVLTEFHHRFTDKDRRRPFDLLNWEPRRFGAPVALLAAPECRNHYHWLFDVLPRLHLLERWREVIEWYAVPAGLNAVQRESLQLLGISSDRLLELQPSDRIRCQHLYVSSLPGSEGCQAPWALRFLRSVFLPPAGATRGEGSRIYIKRGSKSQRPVLNEDELISMLESRDFRSVVLEQHTLLEQIAIFRDARIVVASHGAGLANLVFGQKTAVLELFSQDYLRPDCFFTLAHQVGHQYDCWLDALPPASAKVWGGITVDLETLGRKIDQFDN